MITLKELAEQCDVSIATVSNIINGKSNVSEETRQRVLTIIKQSGYKPNFMARGLRGQSTNTIGLIVDDLTQFSSPLLVDGMTSVFENEGYKVVLENLRYYAKKNTFWTTKEDYNQALNEAILEMLSIRVDGIIYVAGHSRHIDSIPDNLDVPVVISYALSESEKLPSVIIDDYASSVEMTEKLISMGHKNIAVVAGEKTNSHTIERIQGFKDTMEKYGLKIIENAIYYGSWLEDSGYSSCENILKENSDVTAIFCFNDMMAAGVYEALTAAGKTVGEDVSVCGFDNREIAKFLKPRLSTMEIPLTEIGQKSALVLLDQIRKANENISDNKNEVQGVYKIPCNYIPGASVKNLL